MKSWNLRNAFTKTKEISIGEFAALFAAFFMGVVLAVVAPTLDAMEAEKQVQAEQIRAASEVAEAEAAWQETYGSMSNEERLQGF